MSRRNYYQRKKNENFIQDSVCVEMHEDVIFGVDKRAAWKRSEDMKQQIDALFSAHYGQGSKEATKRNETVDWGKLGEQLKQKCKLK